MVGSSLQSPTIVSYDLFVVLPIGPLASGCGQAACRPGFHRLKPKQAAPAQIVLRLGLVTRIALNDPVVDELGCFGGKLTVLGAVGVEVGVVL
jgi:hypothetical protein